MKEHIINSYENSFEETRLTSNNARKIEFLNTTRILDELLDGYLLRNHVIIVGRK